MSRPGTAASRQGTQNLGPSVKLPKDDALRSILPPPNAGEHQQVEEKEVNFNECRTVLGMVESALNKVGNDTYDEDDNARLTHEAIEKNTRLNRLLGELRYAVEKKECPEEVEHRNAVEEKKWVDKIKETKLSPRETKTPTDPWEAQQFCRKFIAQNIDNVLPKTDDNSDDEHFKPPQEKRKIKSRALTRSFTSGLGMGQKSGPSPEESNKSETKEQAVKKELKKQRTSVFTLKKDEVDKRPTPKLDESGQIVIIPQTRDANKQREIETKSFSLAVMRERLLDTLKVRNEELRTLLSKEFGGPGNWGELEESATEAITNTHLYDNLLRYEIEYLQEIRRQQDCEHRFKNELKGLQHQVEEVRLDLNDRKVAKTELDKLIFLKKNELHKRKRATGAAESQLSLAKTALKHISNNTAQQVIVGDVHEIMKEINAMRTIVARMLRNNIELEQRLTTEIRLKCTHQLKCREIEKAVARRHFIEAQPPIPANDDIIGAGNTSTKNTSSNTKSAKEQAVEKSTAARQHAADDAEQKRRKLDSLVSGDYERLDKLFASEGGTMSSSTTVDTMGDSFVAPYVPVTYTNPTTDQDGIDFLTFLVSSEGFNHQEFLRDLSQEQQAQCLQLLCNEIAAVDERLSAVDKLLEHLDLLRASRSLPAAAITLANSALNLFGCNHCSYWIVCSGGQTVQATKRPEGSVSPRTGKGVDTTTRVNAWCAAVGHRAEPMPLNFDGLESGDDEDDTERTVSGRLAMSYMQDGCTFGTGRLWAHSSSTVFKPSEDQARHMALRKTTYSDLKRQVEETPQEQIEFDNRKEILGKEADAPEMDASLIRKGTQKSGEEKYGHWCTIPMKKNGMTIGVLYMEQHDDECNPMRTINEDADENNSDYDPFETTYEKKPCVWTNRGTDRLLLQILGYAMVEMVARADVQRETSGNAERNKHLLSIATEFHRYCRGFSSFLLLLNWSMKQLFRAEKVQVFILQGETLSRLQNAGADASHRPGPELTVPIPSAEADTKIDFPQDGTIRTTFEGDRGLAGFTATRKSSTHVHFIWDESGKMRVASGTAWARKYDDKVDLPMSGSARDPKNGGIIHSWPLMRGRVVTGVIQWTSPCSTLAGHGDNGTFNESRQSHVSILQSFFQMLQLFLDRFVTSSQWQRSHPALKAGMREQFRQEEAARAEANK